MKIFVTGGAGFIGSTLVDRLLAEGHDVDVVDDLSSGSLSNLAEARREAQGRMSFQPLDVRSPDLIEVMARSQPQVVYHLAAHTDVQAAIVDPVRDAEVNVLGSLRVLEGARVSGAQKIVFASSGASIYGEPDPSELPIKESRPQRPGSPHGVGKKAVFDFLHAYRELHNLEFTVLALADVYGPRQDPSRNPGVVAIFASRLLAGEACTVFGDGSQTRDFVYVDDVVDAFARAATRGGGLMLNVGTGTETAVGDIYRLVAAHVGVDRPAVLSGIRAGEMRRYCLDPGRASIHLGWKPWTELGDGVASVVEFLRAGPT